MSRSIDYSGQRHHSLTLLHRTRQDKNGGWYYLCQCSCGNRKEALFANINAGRVKHCGCQRRDPLAPARHVWGDSKIGYRECPFEMFLNLSQQSCWYCGALPSNKLTMYARRKHPVIWSYNGLDRVDSSKGHIPGNLVACCKTCNRAKSDMSYDEFIQWLHRTAQHLLYSNTIKDNS